MKRAEDPERPSDPNDRSWQVAQHGAALLAYRADLPAGAKRSLVVVKTIELGYVSAYVRVVDFGDRAQGEFGYLWFRGWNWGEEFCTLSGSLGCGTERWTTDWGGCVVERTSSPNWREVVGVLDDVGAWKLADVVSDDWTEIPAYGWPYPYGTAPAGGEGPVYGVSVVERGAEGKPDIRLDFVARAPFDDRPVEVAVSKIVSGLPFELLNADPPSKLVQPRQP